MDDLVEEISQPISICKNRSPSRMEYVNESQSRVMCQGQKSWPFDPLCHYPFGGQGHHVCGVTAALTGSQLTLCPLGQN